MGNPSPKRVEDIVEAYHYPIIGSFDLKKPSTGQQSNFFELSHARRSAKALLKLSEQQLSDVLWFSAKVIETHLQPNGYILTQRPTPSAGARHPVDLIISVPFEPDVLKYYNPFNHTLNALKLDSTLVNAFLSHINENIPIREATVIWFIAHKDRTAAKYDLPLSLIWRDAGALIQGIQITCTALGLGSCPFGTLAEPFINQIFNVPSILSAGGIIIGNNLEL